MAFVSIKMARSGCQTGNSATIVSSSLVKIPPIHTQLPS